MENKKMGFMERVSMIQNEMNVPKNLYNKFGNYYYRNAETILEKSKPVCKKYRTTLTVHDEITVIEGRFYVVAVATLRDWDSEQILSVKASAREPDKKKGMDESQITGACSSYARKYALNGLFNLDDNKDPDSDEYTEESKAKADNQSNKKTDERATLLNQYARGYKALTSKGMDLHDEFFVQSCLNETKLPTMDINKLDDQQLKTLIDYFAHVYKEGTWN